MRRTRLFSLLLLASAAALAGCSSRLPTDPGARTANSSLRIRDPQQDPPAIEPDTTPAPTAPAANETLLVVQNVNGKRGGSLTLANFHLVIPAGAFNGTAAVTLRQPDPNVPLVEFVVSPSTKATFKKPATLTVDLSSWTDASIAAAQVLTWDSSVGDWVPAQNAIVDPAARWAK